MLCFPIAVVLCGAIMQWTMLCPAFPCFKHACMHASCSGCILPMLWCAPAALLFS